MTIEFKATADYNAVVAELDKTRQANERLIAKQVDLGKGANEAEKAQVKAYRELQRFAEQTGRAVQTSHEKHRAELDKLKAAFDAGLLTAEQYGRGVEAANQRAAESYDVVAEAVENTAEKQETTTNKSDGLNSAIMKGVVGFASYQAILSKVSEALQFVSAETDKAKASFEGMADPRRRLSQIADAGTPGRSLDELEARVDTLAAQYGESREKVAGAMFSAVSEGFEDALESIVKYGDVVDVGAAAGVAGQVPNLFQGEISPEEAVSTTLLAARQSRLDFEEMAAAMPKIAAGAAMTGSTPTEAMGVLSVMASRFGSGAEAATPFSALATKMSIAEPVGGATDEDRAKAEVDKQAATQRISEIRTEAEQRIEAVDKQRQDAVERQRRLELRLGTATDKTDKQAIEFDLSKVQRELSTALPAALQDIDTKSAAATQAERDKIAAAEETIAAPAGVSLAGKGLLGGIEALQGMDDESRRKFLGESKELNVAYQMLSESLPEVRQRIAELDDELATMRAGGESTIEKQYQEVFGGNTDAAQRRLALERQRQAEITREIANERQLATVGLERQAAIDEQLAEMKEAGEATLSQFAVEKVGQTAEFLGGDETTTDLALGAARRMYGADSNAGFIAQTAEDVGSGGISAANRMAGVERPTGAAAWLPQSGPFGLVGGAVQAGLSIGRGVDGDQTAAAPSRVDQHRPIAIRDQVTVEPGEIPAAAAPSRVDQQRPIAIRDQVTVEPGAAAQPNRVNQQRPNPVRGSDGAFAPGVSLRPDPATSELLIEQRRANQQAAEQMAEQTRALQAIATGGPRSGTSTLTQPQLAAQAIPR